MLKTSFILSSLHSNQKTTIDKSTLPRGERPICLTGVYLHFNFNPRSREGSDARKQTCCKSMSQFQSTLPRGERRCSFYMIGKFWRFQSTLPRGERPLRKYDDAPQPGFQSTLPRGERRITRPYRRGSRLFQSTLPRGERHSPVVIHSNVPIDFNPRSREGSDTDL